MPERFSKMSRMDSNRKQRKARWMGVKNLMKKYPDCSYGGDFYCDHVYEPDRPWVWVDFRFFHTKLKRYFSVAMVTAEWHAWHEAEDKAYSLVEFPETRLVYDATDPNYGKLYKMQPAEEFNRAVVKKDILLNQFLKEEYKVVPTIEIKNYGSVAVGVHATVNTQHIDEHYIRDFITFFRSLGEPIKPGIVWQGEEVTVVPARLNERHQNA